jgi:hypothetical protein
MNMEKKAQGQQHAESSNTSIEILGCPEASEGIARITGGDLDIGPR